MREKKREGGEREKGGRGREGKREGGRLGEKQAWQKDDYSPSSVLIYPVIAAADSFTDKSEPEFLVFHY